MPVKTRSKAPVKRTTTTTAKPRARGAKAQANTQAITQAKVKALSSAQRRAAERFLLEITSLPTAAGREDRVIEAIERWVAQRHARVVLTRDKYGNLIVASHKFRDACAHSAKHATAVKPVLITAHLDHPAFVVHAVRTQGASAMVELEFRGGVHDPYFKGTAIEVFDGATQRSFDAKIISLDSAMDPATKPFKTVIAKLADAKSAKHIAAGCIARWKLPAAKVVNGVAHTHACDDLAAVAAALLAYDTISRDPSLAHVALLFTRCEEIGFIGAIGAARAGTIAPGTRLLCLENSRSFPHDSPIGAGPIVRVGDRLSVFTPELTNRVSTIALEHQKARPAFKFQRKLMAGGACEATAFASFGLNATCICLPLGNYHNMQDIDGVTTSNKRARIGREFIAVADFHGLVELLEITVRRLDDALISNSHEALMERLWSTHKHHVGGSADGVRKHS